MVSSSESAAGDHFSVTSAAAPMAPPNSSKWSINSSLTVESSLLALASPKTRWRNWWIRSVSPL